MIDVVFLICALSLPASHFTHPPVVPWHMDSDEDKLKEWLRKNNPDAEVFIHPNPQEGKLKEDGWERVPIVYRGKQIWIKRKPQSDKKLLRST